MKAASIRSLALASLAMLVMAAPSSAVTILQFGQTNPETDFVTAVASGSSTTLTTNSLAVPGSIPIFITNLAGTPLGTPLDALETFENVVSTGTATTSNGQVVQTFSGTIRITSLTGTNVLTAVFTNAVFSGSGGSASLLGSEPPQDVEFTSDIPEMQDLIAANPAPNFAIGFSDIDPTLSISGGTIRGFEAENAGTFAVNPTAVIPEPSGMVMAGTAMLASLGCFGWRRRRSSRA